MNGLIVKNEKQIIEKDNYLPIEEYFNNLPEIANGFVKNLLQLVNYIEKELPKTTSLIELAKSVVPKDEYRLVFTDEQCNELKKGAIKLMTKKNGKLLANLVNPNTKKIYQHVEVEKLSLAENVVQNVGNYANQLQMAKFMEEMKTLEAKVDQLLLERKLKRKSDAISLLARLEQITQSNDEETKKQRFNKLIDDAEDRREELFELTIATVDAILGQPKKGFEKYITLNQWYNNANKIDDLRNEIRNALMESCVEYYAYNALGDLDNARFSANRCIDYINKLFKSEEDLYRLDGLDKYNGNYWSSILPQEVNKVLSYITNGEYSLQKISVNNEKGIRERYVNWIINGARGVTAPLILVGYKIVKRKR